MFDMNKRADRRQVLTVLAIVFALSCVPALLVLSFHMDGGLFPGILIGIALYFVSLRKN